MARVPTIEEKHPELFSQTLSRPPRERKRVVPMKVLSLGMPRTGTASMQLALNILGFPCYHGLTMIADLRDTVLWNEALDAKFFGKGPAFTRADWDQLLGEWNAAADLPAVAFAEELILCYPDTKVVLVERDIEKWYRSFNEGVILNVWSPVFRLLARLDSHFIGKMAGTSRRWTQGWMKAQSKSEMQKNARVVYREHYALVERVTPPDRLLRLKLEDGWEPLCRFLDKPVPQMAFPRVNEAAALNEKISLIARRGIRHALQSTLKVAWPVAILAVAWWVLRMRR